MEYKFIRFALQMAIDEDGGMRGVAALLKNQSVSHMDKSTH